MEIPNSNTRENPNLPPPSVTEAELRAREDVSELLAELVFTISNTPKDQTFHNHTFTALSFRIKECLTMQN